MKTSEILRKARAVIEDPTHWTQGEYARDAYGEGMYFLGKDATCFCALGAIKKAANVRTDANPHSDFLMAVSRRLHGIGAHDFNDKDSTTHADVLALFDAAINESESIEVTA